MSFFDKIKEFDFTAESWTLYTERLEQFFFANGIDQVDHESYFSNSCWPNYICFNPESPVTCGIKKTLEEIINVLNLYFDPAL